MLVAMTILRLYAASNRCSTTARLEKMAGLLETRQSARPTHRILAFERGEIAAIPGQEVFSAIRSRSTEIERGVASGPGECGGGEQGHRPVVEDGRGTEAPGQTFTAPVDAESGAGDLLDDPRSGDVRLGTGGRLVAFADAQLRWSFFPVRRWYSQLRAMRQRRVTVGTEIPANPPASGRNSSAGVFQSEAAVAPRWLAW
jgi:hypothetical protein